MCRPTVIALTHKRTLGIYKFLQDKAHMLRASLLTNAHRANGQTHAILEYVSVAKNLHNASDNL